MKQANLVAITARIAAVQASIEAMKAQNHPSVSGDTPMYGHDHFSEAESQLLALADEAAALVFEDGPQSVDIKQRIDLPPATPTKEYLEVCEGDIVSGQCVNGPVYEAEALTVSEGAITLRMQKLDGEDLPSPFNRSIGMEMFGQEFRAVIPCKQDIVGTDSI